MSKIYKSLPEKTRKRKEAIIKKNKARKAKEKWTIPKTIEDPKTIGERIIDKLTGK